MITSYEEALGWIQSRLRFGIKPGLGRMKWMLGQLGQPENKIKAVHIAGTNGKGSTVSYLRNILQQAGYKVGTFTSPYIETFNERISINGQPISDNEMVRLVNEVKPVVERLSETDLGEVTEFEVITAMAFHYFGNINTQDFVIFETGLGGRLDSTNVVKPMLTIITNIGFDHTHILGGTVAEITREKAGIVKRGIPVVSAVEQHEAKEILNAVTEEKQADLYLSGSDFHIISYEPLEEGEKFSLSTPFGLWDNLEIKMMGYHQVKNASLAVMAVLYLKAARNIHLTEQHIRMGLNETKWIGRFEKVANQPVTIIDGAHNEEGIESLISALRLHYESKRIHFIFNCLTDKDATGMIAKLESIAASITFTSFEFPRASKAENLYKLCGKEEKFYEENWKEAIASCRERLTRKEDLLVVTGSLYFIAEVREYILEVN